MTGGRHVRKFWDPPGNERVAHATITTWMATEPLQTCCNSI
jgi:hypothetical protein